MSAGVPPKAIISSIAFIACGNTGNPVSCSKCDLMSLKIKESDKELKLLRKAFLKNKAIRKEEYPALEESTISLKKSLLGEITQINKRMDKFQKTVEELKSINVERVADAMLKTRFKF